MSTFVTRIIGICLIIVGIPIFILPIPFGIVLIAIGAALLYGHNLKTIKRQIDDRRRINPRFQKFYSWLTFVCPSFLRKWIRRTTA